MRLLHESSSLLLIFNHSSLKKKKFFFNPKLLRNGAGENPGRNKHAFLKSLDFLNGMEGNTGGRRDGCIYVIGYQRVAGKSRYRRHIVLRDLQRLGSQVNWMRHANRE